jgi:hypothetical protein
VEGQLKFVPTALAVEFNRSVAGLEFLNLVVVRALDPYAAFFGLEDSDRILVRARIW